VNEDALRALVRETLARLDAGRAQPGAPDPMSPAHVASHPSAYKYNITPADDRCVIEPGVQCNHCGYCLSHGH
jgi:hypothetical protein